MPFFIFQQSSIINYFLSLPLLAFLNYLCINYALQPLTSQHG
nr:MAG TPA: hypothetical protein [Caudoviricetes sp.]